MSGYPHRGNNILGVVYNPDFWGQVVTNPATGLTQPYTTIGYANGPGHAYHWENNTGFWRNLSQVDTTDNNFQQMTTFHLSSETHGGEDVSAYAIGPQAHLVSGVHEQSYLAHLVAYAGFLRKERLGCPKGGTNSGVSSVSSSTLAAFITLCITLFTGNMRQL